MQTTELMDCFLMKKKNVFKTEGTGLWDKQIRTKQQRREGLSKLRESDNELGRGGNRK